VSIKPVLSSKELLDKYHSGIHLYAIPDTHRIVSVELLKEIQVYLSSARLSNQIRAIIDKEPT
jgi:hypothetical protein